QHYTEANQTEKGVHYWYTAAQRASERSAHVEAIAHLGQGLQLLQTLPETPERRQQEADIHIALGASLIATKGPTAREVEQTYLRAQHLCEHLDDPHQRFPMLRGLWNYYLVRAELQTAHALGEQLLTLAQQVQDSAMLVAAHRAVAATLFLRGMVTSALPHLAEGMALYNPEQHRASVFQHGEDSGVLCHTYAAWALWYLGSPDQALARSQHAVTL